MILAKKVRLLPTHEQEQLLFASCGVARFAYNRVKAVSERYYKMFGKGLSDKVLSTYFTKLKKRVNFTWLNSHSADIPKQAVKDYIKAKQASFRQYGNGYHVNFKSKHHAKQGFYADYVKTKIRKKSVYISMIGDIRTSRQLPRNRKLSNPRVMFDGKHWYISIGFHHDEPKDNAPSNDIVGVDLGLKDLFTCSNGMVCTNITKTARYQKLIRAKKIAQRQVSKRYVKGSKKQSKRYYKAKKQFNKYTNKLSNITKNHIHQATSALAKTKPTAIVIETLDVKNLMKNRRLSATFQKSNLGFIKHCISYKAQKWGIDLVVADKWFASSQLCSCCHQKYDSDKQGRKWGLAIREWTCIHCGTHHDRDKNASQNLANYGQRYRPLASADTH
ncbi:MAG: transposase [Moraxella sp.]|nr:transposase [Moraxella sp.]